MRCSIKTRSPRSALVAERTTYDEAVLLASVRTRVAKLVGIDIGHGTADSVVQRCDELIAARSSTQPATRPRDDVAGAVTTQAAFAF
ncbi:hypothetical protein B0G80_9042 [Paraburkholderia sp. BL6669N2]|nr:hypothetical protein B0G80_9042 [Paraburkholderia sp. BL6669N2]